MASAPSTSARRPATRPSSKSRSPTDTRSTHPVMRSLLLHLASERGLAENSLHAYRRDLEDLEDHLASRGKLLTTPPAEAFRHYLQSQSKKGQSTKTVARRLAAIRVFLRYLQAEGTDTTPNLQQLERPKPERDLPKVLSRAQVNQLIGAPDPTSPLFSRDVAILEL